jgi:glycosyltransferase involved in cell wall biosynthesis
MFLIKGRARQGHATADARLRIVYVLGTLAIGGTECQTVRLACELARRGHEVSVVALSAGGPLEEVLRDQGVACYILGFRGFRSRELSRMLRPWILPLNPGQIWQILRFAALLIRLRPHVCHALLFWSYIVAMPLSWVLGVPVRVNGRRGYPPAGPRGWPRAILEQLANRSSTHYVTNAVALVKHCSECEGIDAARITVIPNGVDLPTRIATPDSSPARAVMVANLIGYKGHRDVLAALAMMATPLSVAMFGDGPEREPILELAHELGLDEVVDLQGLVTRSADRLPDYQVCVLASHEEGLPNALLEAMAAGLAVVATDVGGVSELITDGVEGLLVPPGDPQALAHALTVLAEDPALRLRLARAARDRAREYTWSACAEAHLSLYRELLA